MTPEEMAQVRPRLVAFAAEMLGELPRSDQRATGELYLRGLMLDGKRKSMQPMAARLGVDHQQLQQFVTSSTWDHVEVRKRIAAGPMSSSTRTPMSSMTPASPRTGPIHPAWPGCIRAHWERSETARSGSACTR